jgi:hypothetical protein
MKRASKTWSAFLGFAFVGAFIFTIASYVALITTNPDDTFKVLQIVAGLVIEFLMIGIPIYCIAFANARVGSIRAFGKTAPNDYAILGPKLLGWARDSHIFWTIFGVPITPTILQTYMYGFVTVVPALIWALNHYSLVA